MPSVPLLCKQKGFVTIPGYLVYLVNKIFEETLFWPRRKSKNNDELKKFYDVKKYEMSNELDNFNFPSFIYIVTGIR